MILQALELQRKYRYKLQLKCHNGFLHSDDKQEQKLFEVHPNLSNLPKYYYLYSFY